MNSIIKQAVIITVMVVCCLQVNAAIGIGGGKTKQKTATGITFTPITLTNSFTLKGTMNYKGGRILSSEKTAPEVIALNSIVTYQKVNTTYILPYKRIVLAPVTNSNNLQFLNFRVKIHN